MSTNRLKTASLRKRQPAWTRTASLLGGTAALLAGLYFTFGYAPKPAVPALDADAHRERITIGGHERSYIVVVPHHLLPGAPLLFVFHGSMENSQGVREATGYAFDLLAASKKFVVIYPDGYQGNWNDCRKAATYPARTENIDDPGLIRALIARIGQQHGTDPRRVFAAGYSNGGQMVLRIAAEMSLDFAGLAAIAATQPTPENFACESTGTPVPMLLVSGTRDPIVPYDGGMISLFGFQLRGTARSFADTARYFAEQNGISSPPTEEALPNTAASGSTSVKVRRYAQAGKPPVMAYTVGSGGHVVPGPRSSFPRLVGTVNRDLDAPGVIWEFFAGLPSTPPQPWTPTGSQRNAMNERIIVRKPGGPGALEVVQEQKPLAQAGQVKIRILASGVAYGDVLLRKGIGRAASAYPVTPGYDLVGVIETLGPGSTRFAVGNRVAALPITGGYQQFICLPESELIPVPPDLDPNEVVSLILNYTTAYQLLTRVIRLKSGDTALMHGAAGGVGTAMLQLAGLLGIKMYGTVSSGKMDVVRQLGGVPIDYQHADFVQAMKTLEPGGVQAVFDPVGGAQLSRSSQVVAKGGTLVMMGASAAAQGNGNPMLTLASTVLRLVALGLRPDSRKVKVYMIESALKKNPEHFREDVATLLGLLQQGKIKPQIARVLPLSEARQAQELLEGGKVTGKMILQP